MIIVTRRMPKKIFAMTIVMFSRSVDNETVCGRIQLEHAVLRGSSL